MLFLLTRTTRFVVASALALGAFLFFLGPQLGSLDADLDSVPEVPILVSTPTSSLDSRDSSISIDARSSSVPHIDLAVSSYEIAAVFEIAAIPLKATPNPAASLDFRLSSLSLESR